VAANEKSLKIASYNTYRPNLDIAAQIASVRKLNADVVVLIELDPPKRAILDGLKDTYPHQHTCFDQQYCFLSIISKTPLSNASALAIWEGSPYTRATLGPEFGNVTIVGTHTTRFPHSRAQLKQIRALVRSLESITGTMLVVGDFNATPFSRVTSTLSQGAGLIRHTNLPTWPAYAQIPQIAIDHIFASPSLRPLTGETIGDAGGSDHFPITMTFAVPVK
jgi:endonuclease/exonuclease/phosphatase (EEP) superfamily protein YafD